MKALVYCRVSSEEQSRSGLSFDHQKKACLRAVAERGWSLERVENEQASGAAKRRPILERMLVDLDALGRDGVLVCARLDRLSRSVLRFAEILERADRKGFAVLVLDPAVDLTTPFGRAMAGMAAVFAQLERDLISQRTRDAMAAKRIRDGGEHPHGDGGRVEDRDVLSTIRAWHAAGLSEAAIAKRLTIEGFPTPRGGAHWQPSTVHVLRKRALRAA